MARVSSTSSRPDIDTLLAEESARVEWKKNVGNVADVVKTLSAFANDHGREGGGWAICGIEEQKDQHGFTRACKVGVDASKYKELRKMVVDWCHRYVEPALDPKVTDEAVPDHPGRRLLVFYVAASSRVHWFKPKKKGVRGVWYRTDSNTCEAPPEVITALMRDKGASPPFIDEPCSDAAITDLDVTLLAEVLQPFDLSRPAHDYLAPGARIDARTPPFVVADSSSGRATPTRLAVLLGCQDPARFLRGAVAIMAIYDGTSKEAGNSQRFDLGGPLPRLIYDVIARLQTHVGHDVDKSQSIATRGQNRPRYARRAIEEAVVNAFVHRDYSVDDPVRIDVFADRIELWSPGGLVRGLEEARLAEGNVVPSWRNVSLVSFVVGLGLAQNLGQGLTTIIEQSQEVTGKRPAIHNEKGWFGVILPAFRPLLSPQAAAPDAAGKPGRPGIVLIAIGGPSIRQVAEHSFVELGLSSADVVVDVSVPYIEPDAHEWLVQARRIRDEMTRWIEDPVYSVFHLFYRGPVVMAPLIGAMVAPVKPLVVYHFENGKYRLAYTLDRRFLHGASR